MLKTEQLNTAAVVGEMRSRSEPQTAVLIDPNISNIASCRFVIIS